MRRPGGIRQVKALRQFWGHRMDHWRGLRASAARSADRNDGGLFRPAGVPGGPAFTVRTASPTRRGTCPLRITRTSGSLVHQATATLTVH
jgi:hypothetical protein